MWLIVTCFDTKELYVVTRQWVYEFREIFLKNISFSTK